MVEHRANRGAMPWADFSKWPNVEEVARAILFLASGENVLTRGALVPVYRPDSSPLLAHGQRRLEDFGQDELLPQR